MINTSHISSLQKWDLYFQIKIWQQTEILKTSILRNHASKTGGKIIIGYQKS